MTLSVRVGGVWKTVANPSVKVGGVYKAVQSGFVRVGGAWKQFFSAIPALSAVAAPGGGSLYWNFNGSDYSSSTNVIASPSGGVAPYFYSWQSDNGSVSFTDQSSDNTTMTSWDGTAANIWCTVSDSASGNVDTNTVLIN